MWAEEWKKVDFPSFYSKSNNSKVQSPSKGLCKSKISYSSSFSAPTTSTSSVSSLSASTTFPNPKSYLLVNTTLAANTLSSNLLEIFLAIS